MPVTNPQPGTNVHEIADGTHRINTSIQIPVARVDSRSTGTSSSTTNPCCSAPGLTASAATPSAGSTRRTCRMPGNAAS